MNFFRYVSTMFFIFGFAVSASASNSVCTIGDLQSCSSCPQLNKVIDLSRPDDGEYFRGAYWNGLFAAYRLNCIEIGKKLLDHNANPNLGGALGSFLVTLSQTWPHNNIVVNQKWVDLTRNYPIDPSWKNPWTNESAIQIIAHGEMSVSYPDIWNELSRSK